MNAKKRDVVQSVGSMVMRIVGYVWTLVACVLDSSIQIPPVGDRSSVFKASVALPTIL